MSLPSSDPPASRGKDCGYAWIVAVTCCFINATLFGAFRSYGILYRVLLETFPGVSRATASWPFSLCMTVIHLTGPISGALNRYFPVSYIMLVGCFLASLGSACCYLASSVTEITIFVGVIQGMGIGLTYVQNSAIINTYFVKFRATANGIALSGGTIGAFILSFLMEKCSVFMNLQECFLLLAVVIFFTLPVCLLLKPVEVREKELKVKDMDTLMTVSGSVYLKSYKTNEVITGVATLPSKTRFGRRQSSIAKPIRSFGNLFVDVVLEMERKMSVYDQQAPPLIQTSQVICCCPASAGPDPEPNRPVSQLATVGIILRNPYFMLTALTHMAYFWGSITFILIIVDYSVDKEIKDGVQLINAFAAGDLVGRLGSGCVMDNQVLPLKYLASLSIGIIGLLLILTTYCSTFYAFVAVSAGLGLLSGVINILLNILFCKYLGVERAPLAFGLSAFFCGLVTLFRPVLVGYFRDSEEGSYDGLFNFLAVLALLAGSLWLLEPLVLKKKCRRVENTLGPEITISNEGHDNPQMQTEA